MFEISVVELFNKVGLTKWPLLACSIIALGIALERAIFFARIPLKYIKFKEELMSKLRSQQVSEAYSYLQSFNHPVAHIAHTYLANKDQPSRAKILSREASILMEEVEARLRGLEVIVHLAPLLGLLGTVAGLVMAFHDIQSIGGHVRAEQLAGGIWEALLSTVFGLIIAIPCVAIYHAFQSAADRIARRMNFIVSELDEFFGQRQQ